MLLRKLEVRLVTLTGAGGIGKTRLALGVASELRTDFADGVYFVSLAALDNPALVVSTIAQTLELKEIEHRTPLDLVQAALSDKCLLLLLDNFERLLPAAPYLTALLARCPQLKILVTSRAVLHVQGEYEVPVSPLALPDLESLPATEALAQYPAMTLFVQRAQAVKPDFQLHDSNASAEFADGAIFHTYHAYECVLSAFIAAHNYPVPPEGWTKLTSPSGKSRGEDAK